MRLHHIGYLVRDIELAIFSFTDRLGYIVESDIIEDPVQTAFVQFLRIPMSDHWIELIAPNGEQSKLSAGARKGGGLHHLCYEVRRIEDVVAAMHAGGMVQLASPAPAIAFSMRPIAWLMGANNQLIELVETGPGALSLATIRGR